jgi:hypothetical protein
MSYSLVDSLGASASFSQIGLNVQAALRWNWFRRLNLALDGLLTALPLGLGAGANQIRLMNVDVQAIVPISLGHSSWTLELIGEYAYRTSSVNSALVSFSNIQGITLFPRLIKELSNGQKFWLSGCFLPILGFGSSVLPFFSSTNSEIDAEVGYRMSAFKTHSIDWTLSASIFALTFSSTARTSVFQISSYSLGARYNF